MKTAFLLSLICIVIARLPLFYQQERPSFRKLFFLSLALTGLFCLGFASMASALFHSALFVLSHAFVLAIELKYPATKKTSPYLLRALSLGPNLFALAFFCPEWRDFAAAFNSVTSSITWISLGIGSSFWQFNLHDRSLLFLGCLLCCVEANLWVRLFIYQLDLEHDQALTVPASEPEQALALSLYRRGWVIGILERWIIFFSILIGKYELAAFILAAKGIVRYRKMELEDFGEYFLVGTLLSIVVAAFLALVILGLLEEPMPAYLLGPLASP